MGTGPEGLEKTLLPHPQPPTPLVAVVTGTSWDTHQPLGQLRAVKASAPDPRGCRTAPGTSTRYGVNLGGLGANWGILGLQQDRGVVPPRFGSLCIVWRCSHPHPAPNMGNQDPSLKSSGLEHRLPRLIAQQLRVRTLHLTEMQRSNLANTPE